MSRTTSKAAANAATGIGITGSILMLLNPLTAPIGLVGLIAVPASRAYRTLLDKQEEKERRNNNMDFLPSISRHSNLPIYPYGNTYVPPEYPESVLAKTRPDLASEVLIEQSKNKMLTSLANSSVATEFARQGRGTYAATKRRRSLFGTELTEVVIRPID